MCAASCQVPCDYIPKKGLSAVVYESDLVLRLLAGAGAEGYAEVAAGQSDRVGPALKNNKDTHLYMSPIRLPTITGRKLRTLKITFTHNIGRFVGRTVPVVG